ncbi:helicase [Gregarina niphandrodes]|uniref:ATP-dependent RNA helicase n=1 Tax=Gregarina niphandrodes TaxID=110365 RepID=A0A023B4K0_GRENI|nr:helicase [Gregarina niphandrodes]EZG56791.1 helicase [Gregarina niphandrodes]|eukprot:XP_011131157.1 helicase [Gregarina niphandrodes]
MHKILSDILKKEYGITALYPYQRDVLSYLSDTEKPVATSMNVGASDLIVYCPTGYGKTMAYVIPILNYLLTTSRKDGARTEQRGKKCERPDGLAALIIVPTKELAGQVSEVIESFLDRINADPNDGSPKLRKLELVTLAALKSVYEERVELQEKQPDVVVSVASRISSHCLQTTSEQWGNSYLWESLRYLVIDEADRLLSNSYDDWVTAVRYITEKADRIRGTKSDDFVKKEDILQRYWKQSGNDTTELEVNEPKVLRAIYPITLQKLLYTATDVKSFKGMASLRLLDPLCIRAQLDVDLLDQFFVITKKPAEHLVEAVLRTAGNKRFKAIIFCPAITKVRQIYKLLVTQGTQLGLEPTHVTTLTGDTSTRRRLEVMARFRKNESRILISTDLTARGINILDINHVYHCGLPHSPDVYIHRIGRTARCGNRGESHLFTNQANKMTAFQDGIRKIRPTSNMEVIRLEPPNEDIKEECERRSLVQ